MVAGGVLDAEGAEEFEVAVEASEVEFEPLEEADAGLGTVAEEGEEAEQAGGTLRGEHAVDVGRFLRAGHRVRPARRRTGRWAHPGMGMMVGTRGRESNNRPPGVTTRPAIVVG